MEVGLAQVLLAPVLTDAPLRSRRQRVSSGVAAHSGVAGSTERSTALTVFPNHETCPMGARAKWLVSGVMAGGFPIGLVYECIGGHGPPIGCCPPDVFRSLG